MAVLGPIVEPMPHLAACEIAQLAPGHGIASESIRQDFRRWSMPLQRLRHEGKSRAFVPFPGDAAFQDLALVIDGAPEIDPLSVHLDVHLIQVPSSVPSAAYGFIADVDTPLQEQVFDVARRQWVSDIWHDRQTDDLGRRFEIAEGVVWSAARLSLLPVGGRRANFPDRTLTAHPHSYRSGLASGNANTHTADT